MLTYILGGGIVATAEDNKSMATMGGNVIIAGLVLQLVWFCFFVIVAGVFHRRLELCPTNMSTRSTIHWRSYLTTLYVASLLIIVRSVFRVIEYAEGNDGYLLSEEAFLYVFDALLMFIVVSWLHWRHPGEIGLLLRDEKADVNQVRLFHLPSKIKATELTTSEF